MKKKTFFLFAAFLCLCSFVSCSNSSKSYEELFDTGVECFKNGDYEKSAECFSAILESNPDDMDALIYLGICYGEFYLDNGSEDFYSGSVYNLERALSLGESENANFALGCIKYYHRDDDYEKYLKEAGEDGLLKLKSIKEGQVDEGKFDNFVSQGTGFLIDSVGFIATNYHVIKEVVEERASISCWTRERGELVEYSAVPVVKDADNDLAIIMINDDRYTPVHIPYTLCMDEAQVGSSVFTMGYPDIWNLGTEIKVTKGIISSSTGFKGDSREYQIDANIFGGNSGGPLFTEEGGLIGVNSASFVKNDNIHYAIKVKMLENLVKKIRHKVCLPVENELDSLSLSEKIAAISPCVYLITISE